MEPIFSFKIPQSIIGTKCLSSSGELITNLGVHKVLIITDKGIVKAGLLSTLEQLLKEINCEFDIFDECHTETPLSVIELCAHKVISGKYDALIGIGGGSCMDTVKITSVVVPNQINAKSIMGQKNLNVNSLTKILIPTTGGTGSEWSKVAMITDDTTGTKSIISGPSLYADLVIIDPELSIGLPCNIAAETGIDALSHAIEAYLNPRHTIISDTLAESAIRLISQNLGKVYMDSKDVEARYCMSVAAAMAMTAFSIAGGGLVHSMDTEITKRTHISHGAALGILLPFVMEYQIRSSSQRLAGIAAFMGETVSNVTNDKAAIKAIEAIKRLISQLNMKSRLNDVNLTSDDVELIATEIWQKYSLKIKAHHPNITQDDIHRILQSAL